MSSAAGRPVSSSPLGLTPVILQFSSVINTAAVAGRSVIFFGVFSVFMLSRTDKKIGFGGVVSAVTPQLVILFVRIDWGASVSQNNIYSFIYHVNVVCFTGMVKFLAQIWMVSLPGKLGNPGR